jgi:hypothetical protein
MDTFCFLMAQKVKVKKKTLFHWLETLKFGKFVQYLKLRWPSTYNAAHEKLHNYFSVASHCNIAAPFLGSYVQFLGSDRMYVVSSFSACPTKKQLGQSNWRQAGHLVSLNQEVEHLGNKFCISTIQILAVWKVAEWCL